MAILETTALTKLKKNLQRKFSYNEFRQMRQLEKNDFNSSRRKLNKEH